MSKLAHRMIAISILLGLLFSIHSVISSAFIRTIGTAEACLPCACENDGRINCLGNEYYGVYTRERSNGTCNIDVWLINQNTGRGRFAFRLTAAEQAAVPEFPEANLLVESYYEVAIYRLTSGEWQVNAGPTGEGKVYVVTFTGCPATGIHEYTYIAEPEA